MAAMLGAGPMADAFFVAFRLPNHFRAIFAEGAFAAAFVPAYARTLEQAGLCRRQAVRRPDRRGADRHQSRAAGRRHDLHPGGGQRARARSRLRRASISPWRSPASPFPIWRWCRWRRLFAGILNANNRFAAAAGAPILLNLSIIATLLLTPFFADAGHAAAWGVLAGRASPSCCWSAAMPRRTATASGCACRGSTSPRADS